MYLGDCIHILPDIPSGIVNMILCDLPYGRTRNKWDVPISMDFLWGQYERILKPGGVVVLTAIQPFTSILVSSNSKWFKYSLVWHKTSPTGYLNAKKRPLPAHEDVLIFYNGPPTYNPQKTTGHPRKVSTAAHKRNSKETSNYGKHGLTTYDSTERYPTSVLTIKSDKQRSAIHPTQKPVALFEWLIRTYTNQGDIVVDNCSGSGTTAIACINSGRDFICIEKGPLEYSLSVDRVNSHT